METALLPIQWENADQLNENLARAALAFPPSSSVHA
jgi:hypothetical protein